MKRTNKKSTKQAKRVDNEVKKFVWTLSKGEKIIEWIKSSTKFPKTLLTKNNFN